MAPGETIDPEQYRGFTRWVLLQAQSGRAAWALFIAGVVDSSFLPMPLEIVMGGLMIGARRKIPLFLAATVGGAILGALFVYAAGAMAMHAIEGAFGAGVITQVERAAERVRESGFVAVAVAGFTPFPWPMIALGAGAAQLNLPVFLAGAVVGRGGRFALIALAVWLWGDHVLRWWTGAPRWAHILFWTAVTMIGIGWLALALRG